jgi:hypothetical protein
VREGKNRENKARKIQCFIKQKMFTLHIRSSIIGVTLSHEFVVSKSRDWRERLKLLEDC